MSLTGHNMRRRRMEAEFEQKKALLDAAPEVTVVEDAPAVAEDVVTEDVEEKPAEDNKVLEQLDQSPTRKTRKSQTEK